LHALENFPELGFQVQAIVKDDVSVGEKGDVSLARFVKVRVYARTH
jgi:hypothetical protein